MNAIRADQIEIRKLLTEFNKLLDDRASNANNDENLNNLSDKFIQIREAFENYKKSQKSIGKISQKRKLEPSPNSDPIYEGSDNRYCCYYHCRLFENPY